MGSPLLFGPLLLDVQGAARRRPQPLRHPRLETYPISHLKNLSAYCYTCGCRAVGAEILLHLFFGELACRCCHHSIKSCTLFRIVYPIAGECKATGKAHNTCRWVMPICKYIMYHTRKHLSIARGINNNFRKQEVFDAATTYLRALLPLRDLYPWRSALKTVAKAGIGVNLSRPPPRLRQTSISTAECGEESGEARVMLGVSGMLKLEKSIARLEKKCSNMTPSPPSLSRLPQGSGNPDEKASIEDIHSSVQSIPASIQNTLTSIQDTPASIHNSQASIENTSVNMEVLPKLSRKTKLKKISAISEKTPSNIQNMEDTPVKVHKKIKKTKLKDAAANTSGIHVETLNNTACIENTSPTAQKKAKLNNTFVNTGNTSNIIQHLSPEVLNTPASTQKTPSNTPSKKTKLKKMHASTLNTYTFADVTPPKTHKKKKLKNFSADADRGSTLTITQDAATDVLSSPANRKIAPHQKIKSKLTNVSDITKNIPANTHNTMSEMLNTCARIENTTPTKTKKAKLKNSHVNTHDFSEVLNSLPDAKNTAFNTQKIPATAPKKTEEAKINNSTVNTQDVSWEGLNTPGSNVSTPDTEGIPVSIGDTHTKVHSKTKTVLVDTLNAPSSEVNTLLHIENTLPKAKKKRSKDTPASTQDSLPISSASTDNTSAATKNTPCKKTKVKKLRNAPLSTENSVASTHNIPAKSHKQTKMLKMNTLIDAESTAASTRDTLPCVLNTNIEDTLPKVQKGKNRKCKGILYTHVSTKNIPSKPWKRDRTQHTQKTENSPPSEQNTSGDMHVIPSKKTKKK